MAADPQFVPPVFEPVYRASPVASCPVCLSDCVDEGFSFWCSSCGEARSPAEVGWFERDHDDYD